MIQRVINDIEEFLNIKINENDIHYFTDGVSGSTVFKLKNKYLVKITDELTIKTQKEFFKYYNEDYLQKLIHINEELNYIIFEFIEGEKFHLELDTHALHIFDQLISITLSYKKYDYNGYGYLFEDNKTWDEFLLDEALNSYKEMPEINMDKVYKALEVVKQYNVYKYLIHGDFGTHNFLLQDNKIKVIDPMCVVGDKLYDFYFAIFSNDEIFENIKLETILKQFDDDFEYKKALLLIVLFIRMGRAKKYDKENFYKYEKIYNNL